MRCYMRSNVPTSDRYITRSLPSLNIFFSSSTRGADNVLQLSLFTALIHGAGGNLIQGSAPVVHHWHDSDNIQPCKLSLTLSLSFFLRALVQRNEPVSRNTSWLDFFFHFFFFFFNQNRNGQNAAILVYDASTEVFLFPSYIPRNNCVSQ